MQWGEAVKMNVNVIAYLVLLTTLGMLSYETKKIQQHPIKTFAIDIPISQ